MKLLFATLFILSTGQLFAQVSYDFHYHFTNSVLFISLPQAKTRVFIVSRQNSAKVDKTVLISDSYRHELQSNNDERHRL